MARCSLVIRAPSRADLVGAALELGKLAGPVLGGTVGEGGAEEVGLVAAGHGVVVDVAVVGSIVAVIELVVVRRGHLVVVVVLAKAERIVRRGGGEPGGVSRAGAGP